MLRCKFSLDMIYIRCVVLSHFYCEADDILCGVDAVYLYTYYHSSFWLYT